MIEYDQVLISMIRRTVPDQIAYNICSVNDPMVELGKLFLSKIEAKSEEELIEEGYKPVSNIGLMWMKEK